MYDLPPMNSNNVKKNTQKIFHNKAFRLIILFIIFIALAGYYVEVSSVGYLHDKVNTLVKGIEGNIWPSKTPATALKNGSQGEYVSQISYEQAIIDSVKEASPSVVSIVISKNLPVYEEQFVNPFGDMPNMGSPFDFQAPQIPQYVQKGTQYQEIGAGSGFIVSGDGLVLTNKHVVSDSTADYTVITNDGTKYTAKVLALDPVQDLAVIKIQIPSGQTTVFPAIKIGDSSGIQIGQGAIAIGNALGQFSNTVSVGVVSGLGRTVSASGGQGFSETLEGIIQTDAAINPGNSGGPLINLKGEVIGINTAMADNAQSIGFAIPINIAKKDINQVVATNKIIYPFLGVRYILVDTQVQQKYHLSVDYGALVLKGPNGEPAVTAGSAAQKAGIQEKDVILEMNGQKITQDNSMEKMIQTYNPAETITLKILRAGKEITVSAVLGQRS